MPKPSLGKLESVDLREYWGDEARDFTTWLASDEGRTLLGETIGLELEIVRQESRVGPFKADILARVVDTSEEEDHLVVVENQLEKTNHDHLGKIISYAAGLKAKTLVWVSESFTDEHRQALDWLNDHAGENLAFFGLQIELWKIGDSPLAPQFKVVSSPNEWTKAIRVEGLSELTDTKQDQMQFWGEVRQYGQEHTSPVQWRKPRPQHWQHISVGRVGFWISLSVNSFQKRVACELYIEGAQRMTAFDLLSAQKQQIETEIGQPLEWRRLEDKKRNRVGAYKTGLSLDNPTQRNEAKVWLVQMGEKFHRAFSQRIRTLDIPDDDSEGEDEA